MNLCEIQAAVSFGMSASFQVVQVGPHISALPLHPESECIAVRRRRQHAAACSVVPLYNAAASTAVYICIISLIITSAGGSGLRPAVWFRFFDAAESAAATQRLAGRGNCLASGKPLSYARLPGNETLPWVRHAMTADHQVS